jgi:hypothetical protein
MQVARRLRRLHPAVIRQRWSWRGFHQTPRGVFAPTGERDFMIVGSPRTGTSLLAAALFQPPHVVTVVEPWLGMAVPPAEMFRSIRERVERGVLDLGTLDFAELRRGAVTRCPEGTSSTSVELAPTGLIGVKWPSFYQYLDALPATRFLICLRHPYEVLASMAKNTGALREGQDYDLPFNRAANALVRSRAQGDFARRVEMFDMIHERLGAHFDRPNVCVVRYEQWWEDRRGLFERVGRFLGVSLREDVVRVSERRDDSGLSKEERAYVRARSRTAHRLGYELEE